MSHSHAVFPGTFDPITLGHLDVIRRGVSLFEKVTVAVAAHTGKSEVFTLEERLELVRDAVAPFERVEVAPLSGLLVDGMRDLGANVVLRGVRSAADLEYERPMALANRALSAEIETVFLIPSAELGHVSSTLVRQIAQLGGDTSSFVPPDVAARLRARFLDS